MQPAVVGEEVAEDPLVGTRQRRCRSPTALRGRAACAADRVASPPRRRASRSAGGSRPARRCRRRARSAARRGPGRRARRAPGGRGRSRRPSRGRSCGSAAPCCRTPARARRCPTPSRATGAKRRPALHADVDPVVEAAVVAAARVGGVVGRAGAAVRDHDPVGAAVPRRGVAGRRRWWRSRHARVGRRRASAPRSGRSPAARLRAASWGHAYAARRPVVAVRRSPSSARAAARTPRPAAARSGGRRARRSARCAAAYSCLPSGVSIRTGVQARRWGRAPRPHVVRRGAHVEHPDVPGQLEAVGHQVRADHRGEPEGVLVEVHPGVQAAGLLEVGPVVRAGGERVARPGVVGEEAEGVEVGAGDPVRLDHGVGAGAAEPQRLRVAGLVVGESGRPSPTRAARSSRCAPAATRSRRAAGGSPRAAAAATRRTPRLTGAVGVPLEPVVRRRVEQPDAEPGVPPQQLRRPLGVVGEQEVVDRVPLAAAGAAPGAARRTAPAAPRAPRPRGAPDGGRQGLDGHLTRVRR